MNTRSRRVKGLIAGAAGAALLLGGSTYALWSASATATGGTIKAGNLDIVSLGAPTIWDVSPDRLDVDTELRTLTTCFDPSLAVDPLDPSYPDRFDAHAIDDLANYTVAPKDQVAFLFPFQMTLQGDNLVARLSLDAAAFAATLGTDFDTWVDVNPIEAAKTGITAEIFVHDPRASVPGLVTIPWTDIRAGLGTLDPTALELGVYQAPNEAAGLEEAPSPEPIPVVNPPTGTDPNACVLVTVEVPDFQGQDVVAVDLTSITLGVKLEQTRDDGIGWFEI